MDRGRSFSLLGLSETATKEQVKTAYERKVARYKGPDYAEEPAYAERKIAQLHQAYQEAYEMAESNPAVYKALHLSGEEQGVDAAKKNVSRLRENDEFNIREKVQQWLEHQDDNKHAKKTKRHGKREFAKVTKPDFSTLRGKLKDIRKNVSSQLDTKEEELDTFDSAPMVNEKDDVFPVSKATKSKSPKAEIFKIVISIVVGIVMLAGSCSDSDIDMTDSDSEPQYAYIYSSDWDIMTETDEKIATMAGKSYDLLLDGNSYGSSTMHDESESDYLEEANLFAEKYFDMDSLTAVTALLYENYPSFGIDTEQPLSVQLDAIFAFYGFADLESAIWYENPYTEDRMCGYNDYLKYLNQYYDM